MVHLWSEPIVCVGTYLIYHQSAKQHISIKGPVALCAYYKDGFYIVGLLWYFFKMPSFFRQSALRAWTLTKLTRSSHLNFLFRWSKTENFKRIMLSDLLYVCLIRLLGNFFDTNYLSKRVSRAWGASNSTITMSLLVFQTSIRLLPISDWRECQLHFGRHFLLWWQK